MDTSLYRPLKEAGLLQHFQMFRDCRLRGAELLAEFAGAPRLPSCKRANHRPPRIVGQCMESEIKSESFVHSHLAIYYSYARGKTSEAFEPET